jgi:hypothetical protein
MRRFSRVAGQLLALLCLLLIGCGRPAAPGDQSEALRPAAGSGPSFLRGDPRLAVAHVGLRRLEFPHVVGPGRSFRERIATDGKGNYSIEPVDALGTSGAEWDGFELLLRGREGFHFRYRDFLVRDPRLFARNWRTTDQERMVEIAGRSCALYRVERTEGKPIAFELSIDAGTGLVLASREFDADGQLVAAMTYENVRFDLDPSTVAWHVPANEEVVLDPADDNLVEALGAQPLRPHLLPRGYGPLETTMVGDGKGAKWLMLTYSDGVEPLFFFQAVKRTSGSGANPREIDTRSEAGLDGAQRAASSVVVFEIGAATAIQGTVDGFELMVIGKAPQAELLDLIESSLP